MEALEMSVVADDWAQFENIKLPDKESTPTSLRSYYKGVREELQRFETLHKNPESPEAKAEREANDIQIAVRCVIITFCICVVFVIGKSVAAIAFSNSVALFVSLVDNVMEMVCTMIMWTVNAIMKKDMPYKFPHGQSRLEPLGVLVFAMILMMTGVMMIEKATDDIIADLNGHEPLHPHLDEVAITVLSTTIVVKIILFVVMRRIPISTVRALSTDHRNDTLANIVALISGLVGSYAWPYVDPIGGILIAIYIIVIWMYEAYKCILKASGRSAPPNIERLIVWAAITHPGNYIRGVTSLKTCSAGDRYNIELEVLACPAPIVTHQELKLSIQQRVRMVTEVGHVFVAIEYIDETFENISTDLTEIDAHNFYKKKKENSDSMNVILNPEDYDTDPGPDFVRSHSQDVLVDMDVLNSTPL